MNVAFNLRDIRKLVAGFSVVTLLFTFFVGVQTAKAVSFPDVQESAWYYEPVNALSEDGVIQGNPDGTYKPANLVNRCEAVTMIIRDLDAQLGADELPEEPSFSDVPADHWCFPYVESAYALNIIDGYPDGSFGPSLPINRAEMAKVLTGAYAWDQTLVETYEGDAQFSDVAEGTWYYPYTMTCYFYGACNGYPDGSYKPAGNVNRAEAAQFIYASGQATEPVNYGDDDDDTTGDDDDTTGDDDDTTGDDDDTTGDDDDDTPVVGGPMTVALGTEAYVGESAPNIPQGASALKVMNIKFTAGADDVKLSGVTLTHKGLGATSSINKAYIYDGADRLTPGMVFSSSEPLDAEFSFNDINIAAGESKELTLVIDTLYTGGGKHKFVVTGVDAVSSNASEVSGSFPVESKEFEIAAVAAGRIRIDKHGSIPTPTAGENQLTVAQFKLTGEGEDGKFKAISLIVKGTVSASDLSNFKLYSGSELVAEDAAVDSNDRMTFDLGENYIDVLDGATEFFTVKADLSAKASNAETIVIYLDEPSDLQVFGTKYSGAYYLTVDDGSNNNMATMSGTYDGVDTTTYTDSSKSDIKTGQVTFSIVSTAAKNLRINATAQEFTRFTTKSAVDGQIELLKVVVQSTTATADTDADVNDLWDSINARANFYNFRIINTETGKSLMGTSELSSTGSDVTQDLTFNSAYPKLKAGVLNTWAVVASVRNQSGLANETFRIDLKAPGSTLATNASIRSTDSNKMLTEVVPSSDAQGPQVTMKNATLTLGRASSPTSKTVVKNSKDQQLLGIILKASEAGAVKVTQLDFTCYFDDDGLGTPLFTAGTDNSVAAKNHMQDVKLYHSTDTGLVSLGSDEIDASTGKVVYDGLSLEIAADTEETFYLVAGQLTNTLGSTTPDYYACDIAAVGDVTAEDEDGYTVTPTAAAINGTTSPTVVLTVVSGGKLEITYSDEPVQSDMILSGTTNVPISRFKAIATTENFTVEKLALVLNTTANSRSVNKVTLKYSTPADLYNTDSAGAIDYNSPKLPPYALSGTATDSAVSTSVAGLYEFTGLNLYVPVDNQSVEFVAYVDTKAITASGASVSGDEIKLNLYTTAGTHFVAKGPATTELNMGTDITSGLTYTNANSKNYASYVFKSVPTLGVYSGTNYGCPAGDLPVGLNPIFCFTVGASTSGPVSFKQVILSLGINNLKSSTNLGNETGFGSTSLLASLLRAVGTTGTETVTTSTNSYNDTTKKITLILSSEENIPAGQTKTYIVKANVEVDNPAGSSALTVSIDQPSSLVKGQVAGDPTLVAAPFVWSDQSSASHSASTTDWANNYKRQISTTLN